VDTVTLVEVQINDGQRLLDRLKEEGVVVSAACWLKPVEEDRWSLYVATPAVDEKGPMEAYRQVHGVLRSLGNASITSSDIKLIGEKHPVAQEVLDLQQRFPGGIPTQFRPPLLGGIPVEDLYLCPLRKVEVTVYGMIFRGDPLGALHLSLEPHVPRGKLVVESGGQCKEYLAETGRDWEVAAPEGASLERDEIGRMVLTWNLYGRRVKTTANEVWSLAKLSLHGFRFLREPIRPETRHFSAP
jgi:hypothetical protein